MKLKSRPGDRNVQLSTRQPASTVETGNRSSAASVRMAPGGNISAGQTAYDNGVGYWLGMDGGVPKFSIGDSAGDKLTWDGDSLDITGSITADSGTIGGWTIGATTITGNNVTLDSAGNVRAGQATFNSGTGFWLGYDGGGKFSVGNSSSNYFVWDGSNIQIKGNYDIIGTADFGSLDNTTTIAFKATGGFSFEGGGDLSLSGGNLIVDGLISSDSTIAIADAAAGTDRVLYFENDTSVFGMGIDASDSDKFTFGASATLGTNNILTATTAGAITLGVSGQTTTFNGTPAGQIVSGAYTPTLTNVTNLDGSVAQECQYLRVGNTVTVSGRATVNPTATAATELGISLPIASNFGAETDCGGVGSCTAVQQSGGIEADVTNDRASLQFLATDAGSRTWCFTFTYQII